MSDAAVGFNKFPCVFVHGMFGWGANEGINNAIPYWGATTGDLMEYLGKMGVECYSASVGPLSGAWDDACELYAQLTGTRVDYGEAHSQLFGHHRYGREYKKAMFEGWGEQKKVHLIGHSFGGNAVRMLAHLLTYGAPEEVEASPDDVSPLFTGGKEAYICSVTTICTPLNGTDAHQTAQMFKLLKPLKMVAFTWAGTFGRSPANGRIVDFHLEQFGLTNRPGEHDADKLRKSIMQLYRTKDNVEFDMSSAGAKRMNDRIRISPNIIYYSFAFNSVRECFNKKLHVPVYTDFALLFFTSVMMMDETHAQHRKNGAVCEFSNDGLVNVNAARYPENEPFNEYCCGEQIQPGVWNVMPLSRGDHGTPIGLFADKHETHAFYARLLAHLHRAEESRKAEKEAATV